MRNKINLPGFISENYLDDQPNSYCHTQIGGIGITQLAIPQMRKSQTYVEMDSAGRITKFVSVGKERTILSVVVQEEGGNNLSAFLAILRSIFYLVDRKIRNILTSV